LHFVQTHQQEKIMNRIARTFARLAFLTFGLLPVSLAAQAQGTSPTPIPPPVLPLITTYRYWPIQFVQFVGPELPYSMIELDVDPSDSKQPLLYVTLTDRATGKRGHYTDSDALVASAAPGDETHKVEIGFDPADTEAPGSIWTVRFTMADGQPLQWRFVQGSDVSEQGSGLNPFPNSKIPIFAYRELGALAGEGTALQIGSTVSTAAVWTEYSHPPYFVPYRGAITESAHLLVFTPGRQTWTVASAPVSLTVGLTWELDSDNGDHRSVRIDKVDGTHVTVTSTDRFQPGVHCTLDGTRTDAGWSIETARFSPLRDGEKHSLILQFATPLSASMHPSDLTLIVGKKKVIGTGQLTAADAPGHSLTLSFSKPAWLSGKSVTEELVLANGSFVLSANP
jgi:hypothetical protein